jgi:hypothetical protein
MMRLAVGLFVLLLPSSARADMRYITEGWIVGQFKLPVVDAGYSTAPYTFALLPIAVPVAGVVRVWR